MTSALFAVHPVIVESVGWISGGPYATAGMFLLAALYAHIESDRRNSLKLFLVSLGLFVLALATSEKSLVYGGLVVLYYIVFANRHWQWKKMAAVVGLTLVDLCIQFSSIGSRYEILNKNGPDLHNPVSIIPVAIISHLQLLFWPEKLSLYHADLISRTELMVSFFLVALLLVAMIVAFLRARRVFFGLAWFFVVMSPMLLPLGIASTVAERYLYLASVGIFFVVAQGVAWLFHKTHDKRFLIVFALIIVALMMRTIARNADYAVPEKFWLATVASSPQAYQAYHNLGMIYEKQGKYDAAIRNYQQTLVIRPDYSDVYYKLGYVFQITGNLRQAEMEYLTAIQLDPTIWQAYQNLGGLYLQVKDYDRAIAYAQKAVQLYPSAEMYANIGIIYAEKKDVRNARKYLTKALSMEPKNEKAQFWLNQLPQ